MKWNRDKKTVEISVAAVCILLGLAGGLLAWTVGQGCQYVFWNRSLTAENEKLSNLLAERNQTVAGKTEEIEELQAQLAKPRTPEEQEEMQEQETEKNADIEKHHIFKGLYGGEVKAVLYEGRDCDELERDLPRLSGCSVYAEIGEWGLDVERTAGALRRHWEQGGRQDGYYVSLTLHPEMFEEGRKPTDAEKQLQGMQEALCALAGAEYAETIREAMAREKGYLWFVRLEQVGELTCCTFEVTEPTYHPDTYYYEGDNIVCTNVGYYIAVSGEWEKKKLSCQCLRIPYTQMVHSSIGTGGTYRVEEVDLNFDGKNDLLIHEGYSGGSGGSWGNYRAAVWEEETGMFVYFPSLPEQITSCEFDSRRVVCNWRSGLSYQVVEVYEVVNGEYVCTRKLVYQSGETEEGFWSELSYYELDELVETHRLSNEEGMESVTDELYPDMNYWPKG